MSAVRGEVDQGRRRVLAGLAVATTFSILSPFARSAGVDYPFTLGVASGDPLPDGFVIWTRLAPLFNAADGHGGLSRTVPVRWRVASDAAMTRVVRQGEVMASERWAHSVHVEVAGLQPGRPYWYQFEGLGAQSPVGQSRTAPALDAMPSARLGFVSCSHWERGYFSAYRHLAQEQPDLVFFLGDYIYDSSYAVGSGKIIRPHGSGNAVSLSDYRNRYALYKTDPDLQALHAVAPSVATWDDHEVQNDYANRWSQDPKIPVGQFLQQRVTRPITNICRCVSAVCPKGRTCAFIGAWTTVGWLVSMCWTADSTAPNNPVFWPMAAIRGTSPITSATTCATPVARCSVGNKRPGWIRALPSRRRSGMLSPRTCW